MGKISPFEILGETFANAFRWIRLFLPIALAVAFVNALLNGYMTEMLLAGASVEPGTFPENFWTTWSVVMIGVLATQIVQLSLFDAVMERRAAWFSFGLARALRRLIPALIGMVLFLLAYVVGIILLVIPGAMAVFLLYMMLPLILLDDIGPFAALKKSWQLTWGNAWRLFAAIIVTFLPIVLGFWVLVVAFGLIPADPAQPVLQPASSLSDWRFWVWILLAGVMGMFIASFYLVAFRALKSANASENNMRAEAVTA